MTSAALLIDESIPEVPVRQWVLCKCRLLPATNATSVSAGSNRLTGLVEGDQRGRAGRIVFMGHADVLAIG